MTIRLESTDMVEDAQGLHMMVRTMAKASEIWRSQMKGGRVSLELRRRQGAVWKIQFSEVSAILQSHW